jgi:hypothetical protein
MNPSNCCDQFFIPKRLLDTGEVIILLPVNVSVQTFMQGVAFLQAH